MKDLVVWVADKNMEAAIGTLFRERHLSLEIRKVTLEIYVHPQRDPGCFQEAAEILRSFRGSFRHGLLMLDFAWKGVPAGSGLELEKKIRRKFERAGMGGWAGVVVLEPELEAWVWNASSKVPECLGWKPKKPSLWEWLQDKGLRLEGERKPGKPKEAMERVLRETRLPRSSSIYANLAARVSLKRCKDPAFARFLSLVRGWFPPSDGGAEDRIGGRC